jgi:fido (protein-threonine AMPylation protein)
MSNHPHRGSLEADALLAIHRYLFPENYDATVAIFEWDAGTIATVAEMIEDALWENPAARLSRPQPPRDQPAGPASSGRGG